MSRKLLDAAIAALLGLTLAGCSSGAKTETDEAKGSLVDVIRQVTDGADNRGQGPDDSQENPESNAALDKYVRMELSQWDEVDPEIQAICSDHSVTADYPSGAVITFTFAEDLGGGPLDQETAEEFDTALREVAQNDAFPLMKRLGVAAPNI